MPQYLMRDLPRHVMRNMARFRLSCHGLAVETGRYIGVPWQERCCDYCLPIRHVQDEHHVAFECEGTKFERCRYADLIRGAGGFVKALISLEWLTLFRSVFKHLICSEQMTMMSCSGMWMIAIMTASSQSRLKAM